MSLISEGLQSIVKLCSVLQLLDFTEFRRFIIHIILPIVESESCVQMADGPFVDGATKFIVKNCLIFIALAEDALV